MQKKDQVYGEHKVRRYLDDISEKSRKLLKLYEDEDKYVWSTIADARIIRVIRVVQQCV